jgi:ornithine carbamoyltransferase
MIQKFRGKDFLDLVDFTREEINDILNVSYDLKMKWARHEPHEYLRGRAVAVVFEKESTRTRTSFQAAIAHLGAQSFYMRPDEMQMARGEPIKDTARAIDRYCDALVIRTRFGGGQERIEEFARYMNNPVINACTDFSHPCQGLADLLTIREKKGDFKGLKMAYAGDPWNVCNSLMVAGGIMGFDVYVAIPEGYSPNPKYQQFAEEAARRSGTRVVVTHDFKEALKNADVLYANTWHSQGFDKEKEKRLKDFTPYQINEKVAQIAKPDFIFMHCLPGYRGEEMTDEIIEGPHSAVWDQAENRMHTEKAILSLFLN